MKVKIKGGMLSFFYFALSLVSLIAVSACSSDAFNSETKRRNPGIQSPKPIEDVSGANPAPQINLIQELGNCEQVDACEQQNFEIQNPNPHTINSLIVADSENFTRPDILNAPIVKFEVNNIDQNSIQNITYSYSKKDFIGNTIIQTDTYNVHEDNGYYFVPIHSNKMGSGVLTSAPFETHIIKINIITDQNLTYSQDLRFFLQTNIINPVTINRSNDIVNSSYYKMDEIQNENIIDAVILKNTLPYNVSLSGNIELINKTMAFLSKTEKIQHREFNICGSSNYSDPCDYYEFTYTENQEYQAALASPFYSLRAIRGSNHIEVPTTLSMVGEYIILDFDNLELLPNEELKLELLSNFNINNTILGDHGSKKIFTGTSYCEDPNSMDCYCFYQLNQNVGYVWFVYGIMFLESIKGSIYPSCDTNHNGFAASEQNLSFSQEPEYNISLIGRKHLSQNRYSITAWLSGFDPLNNFGTLTKIMDTLEATKGFVNESVLNNNINYEGFIPGEI
jgi:hypothetical protein